MHNAESKSIPAKRRVVISAADIRKTLGAMLLKEGLINPADLTAAQKQMVAGGDEMSLLFCLRQNNAIDENRFLDCVRRCQPDVPLGGLLAELQYVDQARLDQAVTIQAEEKFERKLGQILLDNEWVKEKDLTKALAAQLGFEFISPSFEQTDAGLLVKVGIKTCQRYGFLPIIPMGGGIQVAFSDPMNQQARTAAARALSSVIAPVMCTPSCIAGQIVRYSKISQVPSGKSPQESELRVTQLLQVAAESGASDVHIEPLKNTSRVRFRVDGLLHTEREITHRERQALVSQLKSMADLDVAERRRHQTGRCKFNLPEGGREVELRCAFFVTVFGESIAIRFMTQSVGVRKLSELGVYDNVLNRFKEHALEAPSGSIILTGPKGAGITTTLYSCIDHLNNENTSIATAEDNIEYELEGVKQCLVNARIGDSYQQSIQHIVKQDPDVIALGEVRDPEAASSVVHAMLAGHKVIASFPSGDGVGVLLRMKNLNIEAFSVSSTVASLISQRLVRKVCSECAEHYQPTVTERERYALSLEDLSLAEFQLGRGCLACNGTGYRGRIGVYELLIVDEPVREALLAGRTSAQIRQTAIEQSGLITLIEDGILKAASGVTSLEELNRVLPRTSNPRNLSILRTLVA